MSLTPVGVDLLVRDQIERVRDLLEEMLEGRTGIIPAGLDMLVVALSRAAALQELADIGSGRR